MSDLLSHTDPATLLVEIQQGKLDVQQHSASLIGQVDRAVIDSEDALGRAADLAKLLGGAVKRAEEQRRGWVDPLNATVKRINDGFKAITAPIIEARGRLQSKIDPYVREREAAARSAAREAAAKAEAEALQMAEALSKAGAAAASDRVLSQAAKAAHTARHAAHSAPARGAYGSAASARRTWVWEVEDLSKIPLQFLQANPAAIDAEWSRQRAAIKGAAAGKGKAREAEIRHREERAAQAAIPGVRFSVYVTGQVR